MRDSPSANSRASHIVRGSTHTRQLSKALDEYICFYNEHRIKLTLGGKSPTQYRQALAA